MSDREQFVVEALIPTCLGGGDVAYKGMVQRTRTHEYMEGSQVGHRPRIHLRIVSKEICRRLVDFRGSAELTIGVYRGPARVARTRNRKIPKSKSHITVVIVRNSEWSDPGCQGGLRTRRIVVSRSRRPSELPYSHSFVSTCDASSRYVVRVATLPSCDITDPRHDHTAPTST